MAGKFTVLENGVVLSQALLRNFAVLRGAQFAGQRMILCSRSVVSNQVSALVFVVLNRESSFFVMKKHLLLVSDIFGQNAALDALAANFAPNAASVHIVAPYDGIVPEFQTSDAAYAAFLEHCGHDAYLAKVRSALQCMEGPVFLVGFSAGASAAWRALDQDNSGKIGQFVGFYPTRIRYHLGIALHVPTAFIFPSTEALFAVDELIADLASFSHVSCLHTEYAHGFMNPASSGFDPAAHTTFSAYLRALLCDRE